MSSQGTGAATPLRIVLASDGSQDARRAVQWLATLPVPAGTQIRVVSVVTLPPSPLDIPTIREYYRGLRDAARTVAEDAARVLAGRGLMVDARVCEGEPRARILAEAHDWEADLLVVGAKGLGAVKRFLLGSVSTGVVHGAHCGVAVVRGEARPPARVLLACDGSADALAAVRYVGALPLAPNTSVRLLAVVPPMPAIPIASEIAGTPWPPAPEVIAEATAHMERSLVEAEAALGRSAAERVVTVGDPASAILDAGRTADLIVMGARGLGAVGRMMIGSVSERVLQHAECPVLIVKGKA
jgi:nucleotide-binding universal stress UspA family protein